MKVATSQNRFALPAVPILQATNMSDYAEARP